LCRLLERSHYLTIPLETLSELANRLTETHSNALILDLDSLPVDNRFIGRLNREHPALCLIGISSRHFHPELEEAMRAHISACLSKPVNEDELLYWLKNLCVAEPSPRASPCAG
jgi:DNA-binding NtrC family response regulator